MNTQQNTDKAALPPSSCSCSLSKSKVEEIIACLWSLMWIILWVNHAPNWMLWVVGIQAVSNHLCAVVAAIREISSENNQTKEHEE